MPYLGKQSEQVGVSIQKYEFLQATDTSSGTTSFSVPSDSGDHVNVWLNGVLLVEGGSDDYSKSNTAITFNSAPADGDIIRIDVVESFALPDALKSSGDTMTGALKLNGGIKQQTSADLSGTYADHQVMLSDSYSVTGDVTISDNLVLAKISDDSNAVTLTNDTSTRSITGSGSLEASTLVQTPNQSLTAMTGTLGSGVTFPAGMMIQITESAFTAVANRGSTSFGAFGEYSVRCSISNCQSTSKIFISTNVCANGTNDLIAMFALYDVTNSQYVSNMGVDGHFGVSIDENGRQRSTSFQTLYTPPSYNSGTLIIELYAKGSSTDNVRINQRGQGDAYARGTTNIILQEIAG